VGPARYSTGTFVDRKVVCWRVRRRLHGWLAGRQPSVDLSALLLANSSLVNGGLQLSSVDFRAVGEKAPPPHRDGNFGDLWGGIFCGHICLIDSCRRRCWWTSSVQDRYLRRQESRLVCWRVRPALLADY
jgi:hypothetical protein